MLLRSHCIHTPSVLTRRDYIPPHSKPYKVRDGDSWGSCAARAETDAQQCIGAWELIRYNFPSLPKETKNAVAEVNWYLFHYVGCNKVTADRTNFIFGASANPGIIYLPTAPTARIARG